MSWRRKTLVGVTASLSLVGLNDLVLYRSTSILPNEYCRVSEESSADRRLAPGDLTTNDADSGCRRGEVHLCGFQRIVLSEVVEAKPKPC